MRWDDTVRWTDVHCDEDSGRLVNDHLSISSNQLPPPPAAAAATSSSDEHAAQQSIRHLLAQFVYTHLILFHLIPPYFVQTGCAVKRRPQFAVAATGRYEVGRAMLSPRSQPRRTGSLIQSALSSDKMKLPSAVA